jgi:hypothetical protein
VPENAEIVAAFLYWQTVELTDGEAKDGKFRGYNIVGKPLGSRTSPCWSGGGATGDSNGKHALRNYRTDVLRFLPATGGRRIANGLHDVTLRDSGGGNKSPITKGASLVLVYRSAGMAFKGVVLYDGAFTMDHGSDSFSLPVQGFYQASPLDPSGRLTHVVGDGQANFSERLLVDGAVVATNPFRGSLGASWDNVETAVSTLQKDDEVTTSVDRVGLSSFDCLSWPAVVFSTKVQDTDRDGLLDKWESQGFADISDGTFVNLPAMGADPNVRDLFVEIDYMSTPGHSHNPKPAALEMVAEAFRNAPFPSDRRIELHFDTGQGGSFNGGMRFRRPARAFFQAITEWLDGRAVSAH